MDLHAQGKLKLDTLITQRYHLDDAPQAFEDLAAGVNARGIITY